MCSFNPKFANKFPYPNKIKNLKDDYNWGFGCIPIHKDRKFNNILVRWHPSFPSKSVQEQRCVGYPGTGQLGIGGTICASFKKNTKINWHSNSIPRRNTRQKTSCCLKIQKHDKNLEIWRWTRIFCARQNVIYII